MKIVVIASRADRGTAEGRRAISNARLLSDRHDVRLLSVFEPGRSDGLDDLDTIALLERGEHTDEPTRDHELSVQSVVAGCTTAPTLTPRSLGFHALAEIELKRALREMDVDVAVVADLLLVEAVRSMVSNDVAVVVLAEGVPSTSASRYVLADVAVTSDQESAASIGNTLAGSCPSVRVVEPWAPASRPSRTHKKECVAALLASPADLPRIEALVGNFLRSSICSPGWTLHVVLDGPASKSIRRLTDDAGLHGVVAVGDSDRFQTDVAPIVSIVVLCNADLSDGLNIVAHALPEDVQLIIDAPDSDSDAAVLNNALEDRPEINRRVEPARLETFRARRSTALQVWDELLTQAHTEATASSRSQMIADRAIAALQFDQQPVTSTGAPTTPPRTDEEAKLSKRTDAVRWAGTLNEESSTTTEAEILAQNLQLVAVALEAANLPFVVISSENEPARVAIESSNATAAVAACARASIGRAIYAEAIGMDGSFMNRTLAAEATLLQGQRGLRIYTAVVPPSRSLRYGPAQACTIEFWLRSTEAPGFEAPLTPSKRGQTLLSLDPDTTISIGGIPYPTTREVSAAQLNDIDFPIDAVWTWVDDSDAHWLQEREFWLDRTGNLAANSTGGERYTNRDELKYSLRSVAMYAPWIRHLYIVTDDQAPSWLDTSHPRVSVVSHREIFDDANVLPTFNSHAIESQLHHLPGLSESFLYFNDDVFLGRRVAPELFFATNQMARSFSSPNTIPASPPSRDEPGYYSARKNNRRLIEATFARTIVHGYLHTPHALRKSVLAEMEQTFSMEWRKTKASRFRSHHDIAVASSLHHAYGLLTGRVIESQLRSRYIKSGRYEHQQLMRAILSRRNLDAFCLNDTADRDMPKELHDQSMCAFMEAYFPIRADWEVR